MFIIFALLVGGLMTYINQVTTALGSNQEPFSNDIFAEKSVTLNTDDLGLGVKEDGVNVETSGFFSLLDNLREGIKIITDNPWVNFAINTPFFIKNLLVTMGLPYTIAFVINVIVLVIFSFMVISWVLGR